MFIAEEYTMATYTTYSDMRAKLEQLQDFRGNSAIAAFMGHHYIVRRYDTTMLDLNTKTGELLFNNCYYSTTTSKLQNKIKAAFNLTECKERKCFLVTKGSIKQFESLEEAEA